VATKKKVSKKKTKKAKQPVDYVEPEIVTSATKKQDKAMLYIVCAIILITYVTYKAFT